MNKTIIYYFALPILLFSCNAKQPSESTVKTDSKEINMDTISFTKEQIDFAEIKFGNLTDTILNQNTQCVGQVTLPPQSLASISVPLGGFVKEIFVMPNQFVKKGTPLANIANPEYIRIQESFLEYTALSEQLLEEYKRQQTLASYEAASIKKMQQSKADYEVVRAKLQSAEATLLLLGIDKNELIAKGIQPFLSIVSPINGFVTDLNVNLGLYMQPNEIAFELVEKAQLHLYLSVYEKDIDRIQIGDGIIFRLISQPTHTYKATIESIGEKVTSDNRAITVIGHIENQGIDLKSGMHVNAEILSSGKRVKAVPESAIVNHNNKWYIFVDEKGVFHRHEINKGIEQSRWVEIANSEVFPSDSKIVTFGAYYIQAEMQKRLD